MSRRPKTRIERISAAIDRYAVAIWGKQQAQFEPQDQTISDILADLMHYCHFAGMDFDDLLRKGEANFEAETIGWGGRDIDHAG